jgi:hypothetical protein
MCGPWACVRVADERWRWTRQQRSGGGRCLSHSLSPSSWRRRRRGDRVPIKPMHSDRIPMALRWCKGGLRSDGEAKGEKNVWSALSLRCPRDQSNQRPHTRTTIARRRPRDTKLVGRGKQTSCDDCGWCCRLHSRERISARRWKEVGKAICLLSHADLRKGKLYKRLQH